MAKTLQLKRGLKAELPLLAEGEPGFVTDEGRLYIGTGTENVAMARAEDITAVTAEEYTYAELKALVDAQGLVVGQQYLLTDYETVYYQPYSKVVKHSGVTEMLVLTASATNAFLQECSSVEYPQDVVYYDFTADTTEDESATARKGFILRRHDRRQNIN